MGRGRATMCVAVLCGGHNATKRPILIWSDFLTLWFSECWCAGTEEVMGVRGCRREMGGTERCGFPQKPAGMLVDLLLLAKYTSWNVECYWFLPSFASPFHLSCPNFHDITHHFFCIFILHSKESLLTIHIHLVYITRHLLYFVDIWKSETVVIY